MQEQGKFRELANIERLMAGATLLLVFYATLPLWDEVPSSISPQIPWFSFLTNTPTFVDQTAIIILLFSSLALLVLRQTSKFRQLMSLFYGVSFVALILMDQHRLQPWALQFILFSLVLSTSRTRAGFACFRVLVISIYFYSAVSKIDLAFLNSQGQFLLDGLTKAIRVEDIPWSPKEKQMVAAVFPIGELLVAFALITQKFRRYGLIGSILMHVAILLAVGPLGLNHELGVIIWNCYFIAQNFILFRNRSEPQKSDDEQATPGTLLAIGATLLLITLPLLETVGYYDHWPAWAVYSSRPERVEVFLGEKSAESLPEALKQYCGSPAPLDDRIPFLLDQWSFKNQRCPIYPQGRYRIALANALLRSHVDSNDITLEVFESPDRMTGERESRTFRGWDEIDSLRSEFLLNTQSRDRE